MHLVIDMNCDTVPFLLLAQFKGGLSEIEFTVTLFCMRAWFSYLSRKFNAFLPI